MTRQLARWKRVTLHQSLNLNQIWGLGACSPRKFWTLDLKSPELCIFYLFLHLKSSQVGKPRQIKGALCLSLWKVGGTCPCAPSSYVHSPAVIEEICVIFQLIMSTGLIAEGAWHPPLPINLEERWPSKGLISNAKFDQIFNLWFISSIGYTWS